MPHAGHAHAHAHAHAASQAVGCDCIYIRVGVGPLEAPLTILPWELFDNSHSSHSLNVLTDLACDSTAPRLLSCSSPRAEELEHEDSTTGLFLFTTTPALFILCLIVIPLALWLASTVSRFHLPCYPPPHTLTPTHTHRDTETHTPRSPLPLCYSFVLCLFRNTLVPHLPDST